MSPASLTTRDPPEPRAGGAILVVGGAENMRNLLRDWLGEAFPASPVVLAATRADAWQRAVSRRFAVALVILDAPDRSGIDTLWTLRTVAPWMRLVALSSYHAATLHDFALGAGAVACLSLQSPDDCLRLVVAEQLRETGGA